MVVVNRYLDDLQWKLQQRYAWCMVAVQNGGQATHVNFRAPGYNDVIREPNRMISHSVP